MLEDQKLLLNQFFTLWAMLDPISHLPLFLGATADLSSQERRRAAILAVLFSYAVLLFFGFIGQHVLSAMGISLMSFQIAGGIILLLFSISMVLGQPLAATKAAEEAPESALGVAIYPLATPIIAGPGSMLAIILLTDNNRFTLSEQVATFGVLAVVLGLLLTIFLMGDIIFKAIGRGGTNVMRRVMGVILAALSVNLILSAVAEWLKLPPI
ncbi:MarC family protein [Microvirga antarctica]|uniref:MarC family protein n=1 Tax=Microvirga antarctica TaxID=2819233 RepID=UPI001B311B3D|nr:MarC family protein [Microvirga antarctica]